MAAPLGLGKPHRLLNAITRRVAGDDVLGLELLTALSLTPPAEGDGLQARFLAELSAELSPLQRLQALLHWLLELQLGDDTPLLPERNSALAQALRGCDVYHASMQEVSACILGWIVQAQAAGQLRRELPPDVVLCALLARSADPMLAMLRERGYGNAEILAWAMDTCLSGLVPQPAAELRA